MVEGGKMEPGPAVAQQIGPLGLNMGQIISDVNKATEGFKGMKVPVELDVNTGTKTWTIKVSSPPVSEMLKKELGLEKGSGDHKKLQVANIPIEIVIKIAKTKLADALEKDLKAIVKTVAGTCQSLGILIENKKALEICEEIEEGVYDKEIKEEKTEASEEKQQQLNEFFTQLSSKQQAVLKQEAVEQEEKEAKKTKLAEAPAAPKPTAKK